MPLTTGVLVLCLAAAGPVPAPAPTYVDGPQRDLPRIRFADGQISLNDRCPVRRGKLNLAMAPVYVNGRPVGFC